MTTLKKHTIKLIIYFSGLFLIAFGLWTNKYFGKITFDQALSTVVFSTQDAMTGNVSFTRRFVEWCIVWPSIVTLLIALSPLLRWSMVNRKIDKRAGRVSAYIYVPSLHVLVVMAGLGLVGYQYSLLTYVLTHLHGENEYFATQYIDPATVTMTTGKPKSLVLIYVESLESTYSNPEIFQRNLLQRLTQLKTNHLSFDQYQQMPGTEWSVAGIIATQCALPVKIVTLFEGGYLGEPLPHILPSAKCLGDILADHGYKNIYMNGSALNFEGVGKFLADHHYTELYGRDEWKASGLVDRRQMTSWGLPDDMLLAQANLKLAQLIKDGQLFNLTLFMIDTHGVSGQLSQTCAKAGYHDFKGIVECTANQVAEFINHAKQQGWLDKVNIVVVGDHLAMKNLAYQELSASKTRNIFNMIVSNKHFTKNTEHIVHFDMLPTILKSLGFKIHGDRLGLGYAAIGNNNIKQPAHHLAEMEEKLRYASHRYNQLWVTRQNH